MIMSDAEATADANKEINSNLRCAKFEKENLRRPMVDLQNVIPHVPAPHASTTKVARKNAPSGHRDTTIGRYSILMLLRQIPNHGNRLCVVLSRLG